MKLSNPKTTWRTLAAFCAVATSVSMLTASPAAYPQISTSSQSTTVENPRPLAAAVDALQNTFGYVITYEDPPFAYQGDLEDRTSELDGADTEQTQTRRHTRRMLVPVGGTLTFAQPPIAAMNRSAMAALLSQIATAHNSTSRGGRFSIVQTESVFHAVPVAVQDDKGNWVEGGSILDYPIEFPAQSRSCMETVALIAAMLGIQAKVGPVEIGNVPLGPLESARGVSYAANEPARAVLMRTLAQVNSRMTWRLLYDAGAQRYVLNIKSIPVISQAVRHPESTEAPGIGIPPSTVPGPSSGRSTTAVQQ
jgi:hypothetical protein